jgi:hypothetical protein
MAGATAERLLEDDDDVSTEDYKWPLVYIGLVIVLLIIIVLLTLKNYNII